MTPGIDEVRRDLVRDLKGTDEGKALKNSLWAVQKNPEGLFEVESQKLSQLQRTNSPLFRAYLLKESLRAALSAKTERVAKRKMTNWMSWANRSRLPAFRRVAKTIKEHLDGILACVRTGLSNGRSEGMNNKLNAIIRRGFGFHSAGAVIAYAFLCCSGIELPLPRRQLRVRAPTKGGGEPLFAK